MSTNDDQLVHLKESAYADETPLVEAFGSKPRMKIIDTLLESDRDINISQISEESGVCRSAVYNHIDGPLSEWVFVVEPRKIGGSRMLAINDSVPPVKTLRELKQAGRRLDEGNILINVLGSEPRVKILAALLSPPVSEKGNDLGIQGIADQAGLSRSAVYDHLDKLVEMGLVDQTREVAGTKMYEINKGSELAKLFGQLEWELVEHREEVGVE